jgi:hypothetical protein
MSFSSVLHRSELLAASSEIREQICLLYTDLITLVVDVAVKFYKTVNGMIAPTQEQFFACTNSSGMTSGSTNLDIYELFGETIEIFRGRQNTVIELIWQSQIENEDFAEGEAIDVQHLSRWLASQDRVIATINRDHEAYVDNQAVRSSYSVYNDNPLILRITGVHLSLVQQALDQVLPERWPLAPRHWPTRFWQDNPCRLARGASAATSEPQAVRHALLFALSRHSDNRYIVGSG